MYAGADAKFRSCDFIQAFGKMADIPDITMLITDDSADPDELQRLRDAGVEVVLA